MLRVKIAFTPSGAEYLFRHHSYLHSEERLLQDPSHRFLPLSSAERDDGDYMAINIPLLTE